MLSSYILAMIAAAVIGTYLTRILPYIMFKNKHKSENLAFIQKNMPLVIIIVLFFYTLYGIDFSKSPYGLDILLSCLLVFIIHLVFKNGLLSIAIGTICYMLSLRLVG